MKRPFDFTIFCLIGQAMMLCGTLHEPAYAKPVENCYPSTRVAKPIPNVVAPPKCRCANCPHCKCQLPDFAELIRCEVEKQMKENAPSVELAQGPPGPQGPPGELAHNVYVIWLSGGALALAAVSFVVTCAKLL